MEAPRTRGQGGLTLLEVVLVAVLALMVLVPFFGWVGTSLFQQAAAERSNSNSFALGLTSTYFKRDVAAGLAIASSTREDGSPRNDRDLTLGVEAELVDCPDGGAGNGDGGDPRLAIVTTSQQRIVYSLVDSTDVPGTKELWRRTCSNQSTLADATLNDLLLNDAVPTAGVDGTRLARRLEDVTTSCPGGGGGVQNPLCPEVALRATFPDAGTRPSVLRAVRRVDRYAPPGTAPVARITMSTPDENDPKTVTFSGANSYDPRGQGILSYRWSFNGIAGCPAGPAVAVQATCTFPLGEHTVTLEIVSLEGNVGQAVEVVSMKARRPNVEFLGLPYINVVRNQQRTYQVRFTPFDGATVSQYRIDWGDGSSEVVWPTNPSLTSCTASAGCTVALQHSYAQQGVFRISATAIDSNGRSRNRIATVNVESEVLYVAQVAAAVNAVSCGTVALPCREIGYGLTRAAAEGKKAVHVSQGAYGNFTAVGGIDVVGGFTTTFAPGGGVSTVGSFNDTAENLHYGIFVNNVSTPTTISRLRVVGPELVASTSLPPPLSVTAQAVVVRNSSNVTFDRIDVQGLRGPESTGILIDNSRSISLVNSTVYSGAALGGSNSSYGVRVLRSNSALPASSLTVTGGSITAELGAMGRAASSTPTAGPNGCVGQPGGNASGPSSPGGGGVGGGCIGTQQIAGGQGGAGGNYSGDGGSGAGGQIGGGAGGSGGCGSLFGCGTGPGGGRQGVVGQAGAVPLKVVGGLSVGDGDPRAVAAASTWAMAVDLGSVGGNGTSGRGGGGGGGGKSASASGGGGGGGGEGGGGGAGAGTPGFPGGGSFGIYGVNAIITLNGNVTVTASAGRDGGAGLNGAVGGNGGQGGNGGGPSCCQASSGAGGGGGGGGGGGAGSSGGPGGPSIAVFQVGAAGQVIGTVTGAGADVVLNVASTASSGGNGGLGGLGGGGGPGGAGDSNGVSAASGPRGQNGWNGRPGLRFRVWDKQPTVSP